MAYELKTAVGNPTRGGALTKEFERLKDQMSLMVIVLFIGFAAVFMSAFFFFMQVLNERNATYTELLERVIVLEVKLSSCVYVPR